MGKFTETNTVIGRPLYFCPVTGIGDTELLEILWQDAQRLNPFFKETNLPKFRETNLPFFKDVE